MTLWAIYGTCLHEGDSVILRSQQITRLNKMDAKAAIKWSNLVKLSTPKVTQVLLGKAGLQTQAV